MASSGSGYDLSASTFSPDGRIFQVEYAGKAVENAGTVLGIHAQDGVVMGVAKPLYHKMIVPTAGSYKRIHNIDEHAGVASTGFLPDARVVVGRAQDEASNWFDAYGGKIPPHVLADRLGAFVHYFTLHGSLRPFGASCVLAGYDEDKQECGLFMVEPNGSAYQYYGVATGKGKQIAKTELEKFQLHKEPNMNVEEAVRQIAKVLTLLHRENKDLEGKPMELEMSWVCKESKWTHKSVPKAVIKQAQEWAKEQLDAEEDGDDEEEEAMEEG